MGTKSCCRKRVSLWRRARRTPRNGYEPPKLQLQLLASRQATAHGGLCVAYAQRVLRELETHNGPTTNRKEGSNSVSARR